MLFRQQILDGVSASQYTVTDFGGWGWGDSPAGVSPPHSSPVCAKIHSCSLMVPVSLLCLGPHRALALVPGPPTPLSLQV